MPDKKVVLIAVAVVVFLMAGYYLFGAWSLYNHYSQQVAEIEKMTVLDAQTGLSLTAKKAIITGSEEGVFQGEEDDVFSNNYIKFSLSPAFNVEEDYLPEYDFGTIKKGLEHNIEVNFECGPFERVDETRCRIEERFEAKVDCSSTELDPVLQTNNYNCDVSFKKTTKPLTNIKENADPQQKLIDEITETYPAFISKMKKVSFTDFLFEDTDNYFVKLMVKPVSDLTILSNLGVMRYNVPVEAIKNGNVMFFSSGAKTVEEELQTCLSEVVEPKDYPTENFYNGPFGPNYFGAEVYGGDIGFFLTNQEAELKQSPEQSQAAFEEYFKEWYSDWHQKLMQEKDSEKEKAVYRCKTMSEAWAIGVLEYQEKCEKYKKAPTYEIANMLKFSEGKEADFALINTVEICETPNSEINLEEIEEATGIVLEKESVNLSDLFDAGDLSLVETTNGFLIRNPQDRRGITITLEKEDGEYRVEIGRD